MIIKVAFSCMHNFGDVLSFKEEQEQELGAVYTLYFEAIGNCFLLCTKDGYYLIMRLHAYSFTFELRHSFDA